jgi:ribosomal protein S18 acetylase RimI-like enzyme
MSAGTAGKPTASTASELALDAALPVFARVGGGGIHDEGDLRRIATGRPYSSFNHVYAVHLSPSEADARIAAVNAAMAAAGSIPATWWIGPSTQPSDLGVRLAALGMREEESEFGMVIDPAGPRPAVETPPDATIEAVTDDAGLRDWTAVMDASYGWTDRTKADAVLAIYRAPAPGTAPWVHLIVRVDGEAAACGSLFLVDGHAFVTNIGTIPARRRMGLGSVVTCALLDLARERGHRAATLTASVMGRPMYARLGFREDARFERFILDPR